MALLFSCLLAFPCLFFGLSQSRSVPYVDLTHPIRPDTVHWPGSTRFNFTNRYAGPYADAPYVEINDFLTAEHMGTHMDAPAHFHKGGWHLADIPVERFVGPAVVIDISEKAAQNKDAQVTVEDLQAWEKKHGQIPTGSIVLMNSGWGKFWGNDALYRGNDTNDARYLHFPGFHPDAARWLVENRVVSGVGVDTLSTDTGASDTYQTHQILAKANVYGLENIANLDQLPPIGAMLYVLPMKIEDGSGGATRILAVKDGYTTGVHLTHFLGVVGAMSLLGFIAWTVRKRYLLTPHRD